MEKLLSSFARPAAFVAAALFFVLPLHAQRLQETQAGLEPVQLGPVIALRYHTVQPAHHTRSEEVYGGTLARFFDHHVDNTELILLKGDRGDREGQYLELWNFESLGARNALFPTEEGPHPRWDTLMDLLQEEYGGVLTDGVIGEVTFVGDFILIGPGEFTAMPPVKLLGIHHVNVKPGSEERFEHYVSQRMNPHARSGDLWHLYFKGDRGEMKGKYIELWAFDPASARDRYWPQPGIASEAGDRVLAIYQQLWAGMEPMLEEPAEVEYTDWAVVD